MPFPVRPLLFLEGGDVHGHQPDRRYGGFLRYWDEVFKQLVSQGAQPTVVFTRDANPLEASAKSLGLQTFLLQCGTARDYAKAGSRLARIIRETGVNLIHANETIQAFIASLARPEIPIAFHRHHLQPTRKHRVMQRYAQPRCAAVMAVSAAVAKIALTEGVNPTTLWVCHNGLPKASSTRSEQHRLRKIHGVSQDELVVIAVGHLRREKGFDRFIRAASEVTRTGHPVRAILVGDGPERSSLSHLSASSATSIDFVGHQEDVIAWITLADIVVIPSRSEPFGLVAVEALSQGKPILTTRVGGLPEVVSPNCGVLVESNLAGLVEGLGLLVQDATLRDTLGRAGEARYKSRFTSAQMVNRWMLCYQSLLDRP